MNQSKSELNKLPPNINKWFELLTSSNIFSRDMLAIELKNLENAFLAGVKLNSLNIFTAEKDGGIGLDLIQQYYYHKNLAKISATLAFLCAQHSGVLAMLANSNNQDLTKIYLDHRNQFAISFAHLRNYKHSTVTATENVNTYQVSGVLPYVTGYKIFNMLVVGFVCANKEIFALVPFAETTTFKIIKTLDLVTANSANTVVCNLNNHIIDKNMIIKENPIGTFAADNNGVRHVISYTMGLISATLDLISSHKFLEIEKVKNTFLRLLDNFSALENELINLPDNTPTIPTRIKALELCSKAFLFADQIFKGQATQNNHPLVLIKKEAQIIAASASNLQTLIETCSFI